MHRVNWDLRYDAPPALTHSFEINANPGETPASPEGAVVPPGVYTVRLTVDGKAHSERVVVTSDPRSPVKLAALKAQDALIKKLNASDRVAWEAFKQVDTMRAQLRAMTPSDSASEAAKTIRGFIARLDSVGGRAPTPGGGFAGFGGASANARPTFVQLINGFLRQLGNFDNGDVAPTAAMLAAYKSECNGLGKAVAAWRTLNGADLTALNGALAAAGKTPVMKAAGVQAPACGS
jgi:hypothetical protein